MSIGKPSRRGALLLAVAAVLASAACDQTTGIKAVAAGGVRSITITPSTAQVAVGQTTQLTAVIGGDTTGGVTWRTGNAAIATVDNTGLVLGVATGVTTVTALAVADTTKRATATVTVVAGTANLAPRR